jgi:hypothetical protein
MNDALKHTENLRRRKKRTTCPLIDPRSSAKIRVWDFVIAAAMCYTTFFVPYEVAFVRFQSALNAGFLVSRMVDGVFFVDMLLQFLLMVQDNGGVWLDTHRAVAARYLRTWFLIDVVSIFPFDAITGGDEDGALKFVRLARLGKLLRLARLLRIIKRWENWHSLSYETITISRCILVLIVCAHWFACVWGAQVDAASA